MTAYAPRVREAQWVSAEALAGLHDRTVPRRASARRGSRVMTHLRRGLDQQRADPRAGRGEGRVAQPRRDRRLEPVPLPPAACRVPPAADRVPLPSAACRLPRAACRLPPTACRLPPAACRLPPAACRLPPAAAACRVPLTAAACRLPLTACRLPRAACRVPLTAAGLHHPPPHHHHHPATHHPAAIGRVAGCGQPPGTSCTESSGWNCFQPVARSQVLGRSTISG
jgi:hypothetical protein